MKTTKCLNLIKIGQLRVEEKKIPDIADDEVLLKVMACGVCGSDIGRVFVSGTYSLPTVIGHEFAGKVVADKSGELLGKGFAVFPLIPCFKCEQCKKESFACCENYDYYGSRRDGGFTEYLPVKKFNLIPMPNNISYEEAAMCEPAAVARHAVKKLNIRGGEKVLISGAGTIGIIAARWLIIDGAKSVSFIENDHQKIEFAKKAGFDIHNGNDRYDCAIEGTGASSPLAAIISSVNSQGTVVLMGNPYEEIKLSKKDYQRILRSQLKLIGTWNSSYSKEENDWIQALSAISEDKLFIKDLITHKYSIDNICDAFTMMRDKREFYLKVMLTSDK